MIKLKQSFINRFLDIYNSIPLNSNGEKLWPNACNRQGYGVFTASLEGGGRKQFLCHNLAWILLVGDIPKGLVVRHKNDNPTDCCISNLELGTAVENHSDMLSRNRVNLEANRKNMEKAKIKAAQLHRRFLLSDLVYIKKLREEGCTYAEIAVKYGVSQSTIYNICSNKFYKHLKY